MYMIIQRKRDYGTNFLKFNDDGDDEENVSPSLEVKVFLDKYDLNRK